MTLCIFYCKTIIYSCCFPDHWEFIFHGTNKSKPFLRSVQNMGQSTTNSYHFWNIFNCVQENNFMAFSSVVFTMLCLFVYVCVCTWVLDSIAVSLSQIVSDNKVWITTLILWREALSDEYLQKKNKASRHGVSNMWQHGVSSRSNSSSCSTLLLFCTFALLLFCSFFVLFLFSFFALLQSFDYLQSMPW